MLYNLKVLDSGETELDVKTTWNYQISSLILKSFSFTQILTTFA